MLVPKTNMQFHPDMYILCVLTFQRTPIFLNNKTVINQFFSQFTTNKNEIKVPEMWQHKHKNEINPNI